MKRMIALLLLAAATPAPAQPLPPPGAPGYPALQGPVLAIPVLQADLKSKAIAASEAVDAMSAARNALNIVVLDACRDNPLPGSQSTLEFQLPR